MDQEKSFCYSIMPDGIVYSSPIHYKSKATVIMTERGDEISIFDNKSNETDEYHIERFPWYKLKSILMETPSGFFYAPYVPIQITTVK